MFTQEANKKLHIENDRLSNELTMLKHKLSEMQAVNTTVQQYKNQIDLLNQQVMRHIVYDYTSYSYSPLEWKLHLGHNCTYCLRG